jgi:hypothetical protein
VHALDGMFYAFAACCTDPRLEFNTVEKRIEESSVTRQMLRETFSKGKSKEEKKRKSNKSPFFARKKKRS